MEEGTKTKKTVFIGGIGDDVDESVILEAFQTFGDIIEVQLPTANANNSQQSTSKHRGFAFVTFSSSGDAQDAIDNMDLNELRGRVLKVNLARPMKGPSQMSGNRAVWESEEWLKQYARPLAESGGLQGRRNDGESPAPKESAEGEEAGDDDGMEE
ncbi:RNA-binding domain-containing protein [Stereum hirsutum FP-91666 SS1]|uniref:RNA-binding domain-containing protein n=1 Tax=Stereum hirsutum (strain FP-91666) TaxID=721885 RepID=UPI000440CD8C|nr:RNA-binding domain-containing protein [Stereum hirsutum FP-91666 SS1]EIM90044.1 RNA-binding domain-containing protein [Stereum hirsutum FP-91666 SS1]